MDKKIRKTYKKIFFNRLPMANLFTLIAIVGMAGSGKSVASEFFRSKGIAVLRFGDQTDLGLQESGLSRTEENERRYREKIRAELGMAAMAVKIEPRILEAAKSSDVIILDGLSSWEEYVYLKKKFPQMQVLCIWTPPSLRYQRLNTRKERSLTLKLAKSRDISEIENLHKGGPIALCDYMIINDADFMSKLEDFYDRQKIK